MSTNTIPTFTATIAGDVRIAYVRGELLFVARDVFRRLGREYSDPSRDMARACQDEVRQECGLFSGRGHAPLLITVDGLMRYAARYTPEKFSIGNYLVLEAMVVVCQKVSDFKADRRERKAKLEPELVDSIASLKLTSARFRAWLNNNFPPAPKLLIEERMADALSKVDLGNLDYNIVRKVA